MILLRSGVKLGLMKKNLEGKFSLAVNFWGFLLIGSFVVRFVCGYFSYFYGSILIYLSVAYTVIASYATWNSAKIYKKDCHIDNLWKALFAQVLAVLHVVGSIVLIIMDFK